MSLVSAVLKFGMAELNQLIDTPKNQNTVVNQLKYRVNFFNTIEPYAHMLLRTGNLSVNKFGFFSISITPNIVGSVLVLNTPTVPKIEEDACKIVTNILNELLFRPEMSCNYLIITNSHWSDILTNYSGVAILSDQSFVEVSFGIFGNKIEVFMNQNERSIGGLMSKGLEK